VPSKSAPLNKNLQRKINSQSYQDAKNFAVKKENSKADQPKKLV